MQRGNRKMWNYRALRHEFLESRNLLAGLSDGGSPWQNPLLACDVNADGAVSPIDALVSITALNAGQSGFLQGVVAPPALQGRAAAASSQYLDASGDRAFSPIDAVLVINRLAGDDAADEAEIDPAADAQPNEIGDDVPEITLANGFAKVAAALNTAGDKDVFAVVPTEAELNVALFTRGGSLTVEVVDAEGTVLGSATSTGVHTRQPTAVNVEVEAGATYYIIVSGGENVTGQYCLGVMNFAEGEYPTHPPAPGADDDSDGSDDTTTDPAEHPAPVDPAELFGELDANADGSLTLDKFSAWPLPPKADVTIEDVFAKADADESGAVDAEEFAALFANRGVPHHGGPGRGHRGAPPTAAELFARLDADEDDALSLEEFSVIVTFKAREVAVDEIFAAWDIDANQSLSLTEFEAGLATKPKRG